MLDVVLHDVFMEGLSDFLRFAGPCELLEVGEDGVSLGSAGGVCVGGGDAVVLGSSQI